MDGIKITGPEASSLRTSVMQNHFGFHLKFSESTRVSFRLGVFQEIP